ncbi:MAG TPA: small ribosomal subunit Rsm22 family protein [Bryobacteraceae bacterium]|nr:small ribosomal subunit Rsm22 family protein [Bryobacteraceae bacterium]
MIEERAESVGFSALKQAAAAMSEAYRGGTVARVPAAERTAAYLATRMPATYAAAYMVLGEVHSRLGARNIGSVLDIGAGTGATSLAARAWFPHAAITMVERDTPFADAARLFVPDAAVRDLSLPLPTHDLVIAAYSLGEIREAVAMRLWQTARVALVVIEPGTPQGFSLVRGIRDELLKSGAHMIAPCPAESPCPISGKDWCHFAARVERSSIHRRLKNAELGYEDEKYSYVALARDIVALPAARVIRRPEQRPGLIVLQTCTAGGLTTEPVTKRDRDAFRAARKTGWGDAWSSTSRP